MLRIAESCSANVFYLNFIAIHGVTKQRERCLWQLSLPEESGKMIRKEGSFRCSVVSCGVAAPEEGGREASLGGRLARSLGEQPPVFVSVVI